MRLQPPTPLMVFGTGSGVGKTLMTAALCRALQRRGESPLPFKGQNMSLNAFVAESGGEMAYSQALQAWAAGCLPQVAMNPVLLKPQGNSTSEVIHLGRSVGIARAEDYYRDWFRPGWQAIREGLAQLRQQGGRVIAEGAGSPVEVNLQARDLTNLRLAQFLRARCVLVADIEKGGVFAQIVGTLQLMRPVERQLMAGLLINRFRGRRELFTEGRAWLERNTGLPVLGVMPWLDALFPAEDSMDLLDRHARKPDAELSIAVLRLASMSNFSDLDPLEAERTVQLRWLRPGASFEGCAAVVLPGSKQTLGDMEQLEQNGVPAALRRHLDRGGSVFGICGGYQMLGVRLDDPQQLEGGPRACPGLGLLALETRFGAAKALRQRRDTARWPDPGLTLQGFELHRGCTVPLAAACQAASRPDLQALAETEDLGWSNGPGTVAGTYLHGVFDSGPWRRSWLNGLRRRAGLAPLPLAVGDHGVAREQLLDRLTDAFECHVNLEPLLRQAQPRS